MTIDGEMASIIAVGSTILSSVVGYGVFQEKIRNQAAELVELKNYVQEIRAELKQEQKGLVTLQHFEAVVGPLRKTLDDVQVDTKVLLKLVSAMARPT